MNTLNHTATANASLAAAAWSLCRRELVRFMRQRSRIISGLATPLLIWLFLGAGLNRSFRPVGAHETYGYITYFFPGSVLMAVLFTAVFSAISTIEDRNAGFLQGVLVAPVTRGAIALGKILGGTIVATVQGGLFLLLSPWAGLRWDIGGMLAALLVLAAMSFALTSLGFAFAWRMDSVAGFHGVMNIILMPLWLLSGALFPVSGASAWLGWIVRLNPLSYGLAPLRAFLGDGDADPFAPIWLCLLVTALFAVVMYLLAAVQVRPTAERAR